MLLSKNIQVYLKTSDTCNLNCGHCFTNGKNGNKNFFDPIQTSLFLKKIIQKYSVETTRVLYHGGEPMLAPLDDLYKFFDLTKNEIRNISYGIQTNLVYKLSSEKKLFFHEVIGCDGIGTSWDPKIRFGSSRPSSAAQELKLWEDNVKELTVENFNLTLMVSLSADVVRNYEPEQIIQYAIDLGFKYILFERITTDGNTVINANVLPQNAEIDDWIYRMYLQTEKHQFHKKIGNMFLEEIALSIVNGLHTANRCRGCEQKMITINANGTVSGCPNSATEKKWGTIYDEPEQYINSEKRIHAICSEKQRNSICYTCDLSSICNGDCYKLKWDGLICGAPKKLMRYLKNNKTSDYCKELII